MKTIGIILLVLQALALFGSVANGSILGLLNFSSIPAIMETLGFFLPAIIGIILLSKAAKKKSDNGEAGK